MDLHCTQNLFAFHPDQSCTQDYTPPKSGLFIDDLPAISIASMSGIGKHTYKSAQEALNAKTRLAVTSIMQELQGEMLISGRVMPQMQPTTTVGKFNGVYQAPAAPAAGLNLRRTSSCTPLSVLYLHSITYSGDATENVTIEIRNEQTGSLLDTYGVSAVANVPTSVIVDKHYSVNVRIVATASGLRELVRFADNCSCLYQYECKRGVTQRHRHIEAVGYDGVQESEYGYGITVCAAARCYLPALVCHTLPVISAALYYKVGALLLQEMLSYQAPTEYTNGYVAKSPLQAQYEGLKTESKEAIRIAVMSMLKSLEQTDSFCISCNTPNAVVRRSLS